MAEGHRKRMRERFYKEGLDNFEPHEALEVLLFYALPRVDTNELAHRLINSFGSFHAVLEASREDLIKFGLTEKTVALLKMLPAFSNYYMQSHIKGIRTLTDSSSVGLYCVDALGLRTNEVFGVICLDTQNSVKNFEIIAEGTVNSATVFPRLVAEVAIRNNSSSVVLTHNHPSGSLSPSSEDKLLTLKLQSMLDSIEINLLDHVIVANGRFFSMREHGIL